MARAGSPNGSGSLSDQRARVAAGARRLACEGLVIGTAGNVSERTGDLVAITATGAVCATVDVDQVTVIDLDGRVVAGEFEPTSELELHLGVYRRYQAGAVVHTHPPVATAVACVLDELPCVHYNMLALGGAVRVAPYRTFGTAELAEVTLDALADRTAALMASHGAISYGSDVDAAIDASVLLEWASTLYWRAAALGTPRTLDQQQHSAVLAALTERRYGKPRRIER